VLQSLRVWENTQSKIFYRLCLSLLFQFWHTGILQSLMSNVIVSFRAYLDCHLMVTNPLDYVEPLGKAGASGFTFHVEVSRGWLSCCSHCSYFSCSLPVFTYTGFFLADNWGELVQRIKSKGMRPGVSLKPGTPIEEVYPLVWNFYSDMLQQNNE